MIFGQNIIQPTHLFDPIVSNLGYRLTDWRNKGGMGRRVVAEIGYAVLAVATPTEFVARAALLILCETIYVGMCVGGVFSQSLRKGICEMESVTNYSFQGVNQCISAYFHSIKALCQNPFFQEIKYFN